MNLKLLIVDDEPLARERLRRLLASEVALTVVGECADGASAVRAVRELRPDVLLLDVQMPELDGFGVLAALEAEERPAVIFTTAHDRFALRAFEVHAVDYLLKPFDRARLATALERVRERLAAGQRAAGDERLNALLAELRPATAEKIAGRLAVKSGSRTLFIEVDDLDWVEAADNYVTLHTDGAEHLLRETMAAMEARLPTEQFVRVSRSAIVNVKRIRELQPLFHGDQVAVLHNGTKVNVSRTHRARVMDTLGMK